MNFSALTLTRKALHPFSRWPGKKGWGFGKIMDLFPPHTFPALHYGWKWIAFGKGFKTDASNWNVPISGWLTRFPSWPLWKRLKNAFCLFYCNRLTVQIDSFKKSCWYSSVGKRAQRKRHALVWIPHMTKLFFSRVRLRDSKLVSPPFSMKQSTRLRPSSTVERIKDLSLL